MKLNKIIQYITLSSLLLTGCKDHNKYKQIYQGPDKSNQIQYKVIKTTKIEKYNGQPKITGKNYTIIIINKGDYDGKIIGFKEDGYWKSITPINIDTDNKLTNYTSIDSLENLLLESINRNKKNEKRN